MTDSNKNIWLHRWVSQLQSNQAVVYVCMSVLLVCCVVVFIALPAIGQYYSTSNQLKQFTTVIQQQKAESVDTKTIESMQNELNETWLTQKNKFFTTQQFEQFSITQLATIAQQHALQLQSLTFLTPTVIDNGLNKHEVSFNFDATFEGLTQFIHTLEHYDKLIKIESITTQRIKTQPVILNTALTLAIYTIAQES